MAELGTIYLLHFDQPYKHARHYLGWARSLKSRLEQHQRGGGARLLQVAKRAGITWRVARTWENKDRHQERRWKKHGHQARLCTICRSKTSDPEGK